MEGYRIDRTLITALEMRSILAGLRSLDSVSGTRRRIFSLIFLLGTRAVLQLKSNSFKGQSSIPGSFNLTIFRPKGRHSGSSSRITGSFDGPPGMCGGGVTPGRRFFKLVRMTGFATGELFEPRPNTPIRFERRASFRASVSDNSAVLAGISMASCRGKWCGELCLAGRGKTAFRRCFPDETSALG